MQSNTAANTATARSRSAAVYAAACHCVAGKRGRGWERVKAEGCSWGRRAGSRGRVKDQEGVGVNKEPKGVRCSGLSWVCACFSHLCMVLLRGDNLQQDLPHTSLAERHCHRSGTGTPPLPSFGRCIGLYQACTAKSRIWANFRISWLSNVRKAIFLPDKCLNVHM